MMARICQEHLPPGVLNVLTGLGEECGGPLAQHPLVRKLSFTGSTATGAMVIDGQKRFITNAPLADLFVVFARTRPAGRREDGTPGTGIAVFLVPTSSPGL